MGARAHDIPDAPSGWGRGAQASGARVGAWVGPAARPAAEVAAGL